MQTKLISMTNENLDRQGLETCAEAIKNGGLVAFPTETVYGLGANAFDGAACAKIYEAKRRPPEKALILHLSDKIDPSSFAEINDAYLKLKKAFPIGPITFVLPLKADLPTVVTAGGNTVAFRFPENPIAREFIDLCGVPIAAPSANISGKEPPTDATSVINDFSGVIDCIIDGGDCAVGTPSTIVSLIGEPKILREGAIPAEEVLKCLK